MPGSNFLLERTLKAKKKRRERTSWAEYYKKSVIFQHLSWKEKIEDRSCIISLPYFFPFNNQFVNK